MKRRDFLARLSAAAAVIGWRDRYSLCHYAVERLKRGER